MEEEDDWSVLVGEARDALLERQAELFAGLGSDVHWHYDLDDAVIEFSRNGRLLRSVPIVVVGTTSAHEGTWLWSWANETLPPQATRGIERVRAFGEQHGFGGLTIGEWPAETCAVGDVVAVAGHVLQASGFFRAPLGDVLMFLLLDPHR